MSFCSCFVIVLFLRYISFVVFGQRSDKRVEGSTPQNTGHTKTIKEHNMNALKRSRGLYAAKVVSDRPLTSYEAVKEKLKMSQAECVELRKEVDEMRSQTGDVSGDVEEIRSALDDSEREILKLEGIIEDLVEEKKKIHRQNAMFRLLIEKLKGTISRSSDAYDALVEKVETIEINLTETEGNKLDRIRRSVCGAFGWCEKRADPRLLRAACGFWQGCSMLDLDGVDGTSMKSRQDMWIELTCVGFKGKVLEALEKAFRKVTRFDVVELARKSDVHSQFNATAVIWSCIKV
jgi:hypothetical protein